MKGKRMKFSNFNPRAPRGARPRLIPYFCGDEYISIHGLREEPDSWAYDRRHLGDISIHGLRVEPDRAAEKAGRPLRISIHGLRVEPDSHLCELVHTNYIFQSTGSVWSPTQSARHFLQKTKISIHGLRVEPDLHLLSLRGQRSYFNPRAPRGARPVFINLEEFGEVFQSTGSARSPTSPSVPHMLANDISIHGLREEPDQGDIHQHNRLRISIHGLREEPDFPSTGSGASWSYFNPRAPRGARPRRQRTDRRGKKHFNPRAPRGARLSFYHHFTPPRGISIHGLREAPDQNKENQGNEPRGNCISIHGLREEPDIIIYALQNVNKNFNPRAPRGARRAD